MTLPRRRYNDDGTTTVRFAARSLRGQEILDEIRVALTSPCLARPIRSRWRVFARRLPLSGPTQWTLREPPTGVPGHRGAPACSGATPSPFGLGVGEFRDFHEVHAGPGRRPPQANADGRPSHARRRRQRHAGLYRKTLALTRCRPVLRAAYLAHEAEKASLASTVAPIAWPTWSRRAIRSVSAPRLDGAAPARKAPSWPSRLAHGLGRRGGCVTKNAGCRHPRKKCGPPQENPNRTTKPPRGCAISQLNSRSMATSSSCCLTWLSRGSFQIRTRAL